MCGFAGVVRLDNEQKADVNLVKIMTETLVHRGPDEEGYFSQGPCALGHRRLKIIDLVTGRQPIFNEDRSVVIVYSGEVYNFMELREGLMGKGHRFYTNTDTEVIIHAYEEWGEDCVNHFRGIFAFALWDQKDRKLILARDRVGVKPLYYYIDQKQVVFGSEVKTIIANPEVPRSLDPQALYCYFSMLYVPGPFSGVRGVYKLLPGHLLIVEKGKTRLKRYWELQEESPSRPGLQEPGQKLRDEIFRSVKEELISEVPLGIFLSGGIDSSSVLAAASRTASNRINAYTVGFKEKYWDESEKAKEVADILKARHSLLTNEPHELADLIQKLIFYMDEPHANYTMVVNYLVCQAARKEITVALAGTGGDELFGGYRQFQADKISSYYSALIPYTLRKGFFSALLKVLSYNDQEPSTRRRLARAISVDHTDPVIRHLHWVYFQGWHEGLSPINLFREEAFREIKRAGPDPFEHLARYAREYDGKDRLNKFLYLDMRTYLLDDLITMTDRMSMANSLELRVPLLDHELIEYVFSLPSHYKIAGLRRKKLLKNYLSEFLPERIINMPKQGFGVPLLLWIKNELRDMIYDVIASSSLRQDPLILKEPLERAFQEHLEGKRDHTSRVWSAVAYLMWKDTFKIS